MGEINTISDQLGIDKKELKLLRLHIFDVDHNNKKKDYIEYSTNNSWVYKEYIDDTCIYYEDNTKLIRLYGRH